MSNGTHDNAAQYGGDCPLPPSLRDAAKALASHLRQNSAMLTMPALNAIMAVEAAVEREKEPPEPRQRAIDSLRVAYGEQKARAEKAEAEVSSAAVKFLAMHQRAEKAEAELATFRSFFVSAHQISDTMPAAEAVAGAQGIIDRDAGQLARLGHSTPMNVGKVLPLVVDELLRLRAEVAELRRINTSLAEQRDQFADAAGLGRKFAGDRGCDLHALLENVGVPGVSTNMTQMSLGERIGWLIGEWKRLDSAIRKVAGDPPYPLVRDQATGALGVKVGIVRDPVTGWTFDKFRRELESARATAKGNAGLFAQAMQELAAAKGGA